MVTLVPHVRSYTPGLESIKSNWSMIYKVSNSLPTERRNTLLLLIDLFVSGRSKLRLNGPVGTRFDAQVLTKVPLMSNGVIELRLVEEVIFYSWLLDLVCVKVSHKHV
jgi:hypothetical protein